jgi:RNA polymerase sigma factor (sigma-70 family)
MRSLYLAGNPDLALRQEERRRLGTAIMRLPALQQEVLRLHYRDGLRAAQIAELVGKRAGAIQKLLSRTIIHLRVLYEDQQEGANDS